MAESLFSKLSGLLAFGGGDNAIGLSIGTSSIKLVELKKSGKSWKLLHFGIVQLPDETIANREITNQIAVVENLRTLVGQLKMKNKSACISLNGPSLIIKRMSIEVVDKKDLQEQVFWEAEQYIPFDISQVVMDFQVLSNSKDGKMDVLLVAVKKSELEAYMGCVQDAGLKPSVVDTDFFALQNVFEANYPVNPSEAVAVVDVGAASIKTVVMHAGVPVFTKDAAIGGRKLTEEIQKQLNLSFADAESLKVGGGQAGAMPQEVSDLMHVMAENFAAEIKRVIDFYSASSVGAPVSYALLGGGAARMPELSKIVEDTLGMPAQMINPFNSISYDPSIFTQDYITAIGPVAAIPVGLALRAGAK